MLRVGEILGLTWDNVHVEEADIARDDAYVYVDKEFQRASIKAIEALDKKERHARVSIHTAEFKDAADTEDA